MDAIEIFVSKTTCPAAVLGNAEGFQLVYLDKISEFNRLDAAKRGLAFCGCVGLLAGQIAVQPEPYSICEVITLRAALRYVQDLNREHAPQDDSASWLKNLFALPDTRTEEFGPA